MIINDRTTEFFTEFFNGIDQPLCVYLTEGSAAEERYFYCSDNIGSITAMVNSDGTIAERYSYDPWGEPTITNASGSVITDSAIGNPFMFTAREVDIFDNGALKLQHNRHRVYNYDLARWMQPDPSGYSDGLNIYQYASGNPILYTDPLGLWSWRNNDDVWVIQTILKNNGYNLGNFGAGQNGIDGKYGIDSSLSYSEASSKATSSEGNGSSYTSRAVLAFQEKLNLLGCDSGCPDGLWGSETTSAFKKCENEGRVNWRYAHIQLGVFAGGGYYMPENVGESGTEWEGYRANMISKNFSFGYNKGKIKIQYSGNLQGGVEVGAMVVLAYNIFDNDDWLALSETKVDWNLQLGPLQSKIAGLFKGQGKIAVETLSVLLKNRGNIEAASSIIEAYAMDAVWHGTPNKVMVPFTWGVGGAYGERTTNFSLMAISSSRPNIKAWVTQ